METYFNLKRQKDTCIAHRYAFCIHSGLFAYGYFSIFAPSRKQTAYNRVYLFGKWLVLQKYHSYIQLEALLSGKTSGGSGSNLRWFHLERPLACFKTCGSFPKTAAGLIRALSAGMETAFPESFPQLEGVAGCT